MEIAEAEKEEIREGEQYTKDGTVDLKGRPCLRSKGGGWTACSFLFASEVFERFTYYGIAPNLMLYLTDKLHQGTVTSANNVTNWMGTTMMTPIIVAYIADAHLGRYWTIIISFIIYLMGMCLLTLTVSVPSLRPSPCSSSNIEDCSGHTKRIHVVAFYCSLYIIALGLGGLKVNCLAMGANQFDKYEPKEQTQKLSFFNWSICLVSIGNLLSVVIFSYIQDKVSWPLGYGIPTIMLAVSMLVFLSGTPHYRHNVASGSPFTRIAQVLMAAIRNWRVPLPKEPKHLYEVNSECCSGMGNHQIEHTDSLRFLDRAAIRSGSGGPWVLCTVTQVEETKQIIKILPIFMVTIMPSVIMAQVLTLFIKQGTTLDRSMGHHFKIPPASLSAFYIIGTLVSIVWYDKWFVPLIRKHTKNPRGITILQRIGIGQVLHIMTMIASALIERWRLSVVKKHGVVLQNEIVPVSVFVLLPQFVWTGVAVTLVEVGKMEFFYDQAPEKIKSLGASFFSSSYGIGSFLSSFLLSVVSKVSKKNDRNGWIENDLNASHLDYYYGLIAALCVINLILFLFVSKFYVYSSNGVQSEIELKKVLVEVTPTSKVGSK